MKALVYQGPALENRPMPQIEAPTDVFSRAANTGALKVIISA